VGLGGNVGQVEETFKHALLGLANAGLQLLRVSALYSTAPVGGVPQPDYLNAVAEFSTDLHPETVLKILLAQERAQGRNREAELRWGPRTLDLDYLLDQHFINYSSDALQVPHPRIWQRAFVVVPLADLLPDLVTPTRLTVADLALQLNQEHIVVASK